MRVSHRESCHRPRLDPSSWPHCPGGQLFTDGLAQPTADGASPCSGRAPAHCRHERETAKAGRTRQKERSSSRSNTDAGAPQLRQGSGLIKLPATLTECSKGRYSGGAGHGHRRNAQRLGQPASIMLDPTRIGNNLNRIARQAHLMRPHLIRGKAKDCLGRFEVLLRKALFNVSFVLRGLRFLGSP